MLPLDGLPYLIINSCMSMGFGSNRQAIDMRGWKATEERLMGPLPAKAIIAKSLRGRSEARGREGGISGKQWRQQTGRVNFRRGGGRETVCLAGAWLAAWLDPSSLAFHAFRAVSAAVIAQSIRLSVSTCDFHEGEPSSTQSNGI